MTRPGLFAVVLLALVACSGSGQTGVEAEVDVDVDVDIDVDAGVEADVDAGVEAGVEAEAEPTGEQTPTTYRYEVVATHPHDTSSYTQGLEFVDGLLLESTGRRGRSTIRLVEPETGLPIDNVDLPGTLYGEGATVVGDEVWQLTYTSETVLVRDLEGLAEQRRFSYRDEGWGLCHDGGRLIMSNGSAELTIRDPTDFSVTDRVTVTLDDEKVEELNELECVDGMVWANIYQTNRIVEINPETGQVVGVLDLTGLVPEEFAGDRNLVLNGIAHNPETGRFWITGKLWPTMFELDLLPQP